MMRRCSIYIMLVVLPLLAILHLADTYAQLTHHLRENDKKKDCEVHDESFGYMIPVKE